MKSILIIEDDQTLRAQMAQVLRYEGFATLEAADGKSGVETAIRAVPDLIICDIMMPELDGFDVIQLLRGDPRTAMIPFIFLTALIASQDQRHGMEEGADDYITKPYDPQTLLGSVRRRLEKRSRQIEESRLRAEEVSLAVAAAIPQEILESLDHITTVTNLLVLKHAGDDPQIAATHQSVAQEAVRLRRMMRRLHLYAHLPQLYAQRFDLLKEQPQTAPGATVGRVAREVCRNWKREPDLVIVSDLTELPLSEDYLKLIVEELVDNACKFSIPGTPIEVTGHGQREFWSLAVSNRGPGMSADQIARIGAFKQFWTGNKKPPGLGLGLALTQGIARLHHCEFTIQSEAEVVTATVLMPLEA
ncbi:MAG: response regulator [Verrucomicrobiae bacterium]|nr:response regulator [Verrucomicrobiae bacterium]